MTDISLPWPPKELSPNARVHHMARAKHTKQYRDQAYWFTKMATHGEVEGFEGEDEIIVRCEFHPPDRRRRDLDGMFSSIKAGLDGIADALVINDNRFGFELFRRHPLPGGRVLVTINAGERK